MNKLRYVVIKCIENFTKKRINRDGIVLGRKKKTPNDVIGKFSTEVLKKRVLFRFK